MHLFNEHNNQYYLLPIQLFLVFGLVTMLLLGAQSSAFRYNQMLLERNQTLLEDEKAKLEHNQKLLEDEKATTLRFAKQLISANELVLSRTAHVAKDAYEEMQKSGKAFVRYVRKVGRSEMAMDLTRDVIEPARAESRRLINTLYPQLLESHGLAIALRIGPIAEELDKLGLCYLPQIRGNTSGLSSKMQTMVYRLICEIALLLASYPHVNEIALILRVGTFKGRFGVMIWMQGYAQEQQGLGPQSESSTPFQEALSLTDIEAHVYVHHGLMRFKEQGLRKSLMILLPDGN
jgi:signal transduction histidine kinase